MTPPEPSPAGTVRDVGHRAPAGEGDRLRDQLLDAAEHQLVERGSIAAVSLRQVARDVGVSATSVYLHFTDKDDLFIHVCQRRFQALAELMRTARAGADSATEQLRLAGGAYVRFGLEHPEQYQALLSLKLEEVMTRIPEDELVGLQTLQEMAEVVVAGIEAGEFKPVDPFGAAISLWATVHGLVSVIHHSITMMEEIDSEALLEQTLDMVMHGLHA